jgi:hypothetical protein
MSLLDAVRTAVAIAAAEGRSAVLVGGLAVSVRAEPRFTRDADLVVAVDSDIEAEAMVRSFLVRGYRVLVAATGHLIALKLLSVAPGRETDAADLRSLARVADDAEWSRAAKAVALIVERGFHRGRDLVADLEALRAGGEVRRSG